MENLCQSCAMPLTKALYGTNADGSPNPDYCRYCYENGAFAMEFTLEEAVEICVKVNSEIAGTQTKEEARRYFRETLPTLKRWKKA